MEQLDKTLNLYLVNKAPALPANAKEVLVKFMPWITLVLLILALPAVLVLFGLSTFLMPISFFAGVGNGFSYMLAMGALVVTLVLEAMAIPGLFNKSKAAWRLLYLSALVNAVYNLLTFNLGGLIIGTLLSLYLLYQVKSYYH